MSSANLPERFTYPSPAFGKFWNSLLGKAVLAYIGKPDESDIYHFGEQLLVGDPLADEVADLLSGCL